MLFLIEITGSSLLILVGTQSIISDNYNKPTRRSIFVLLCCTAVTFTPQIIVILNQHEFLF